MHHKFYKKQEVSVTASFFLQEKNSSIARYWPDNVVQSFTNPAWAEGAKGTGIGEWLRFTFAVPRRVQKIRIVNGYTRSKQLYMKNGRVKSLQGTTSTGKKFTITLKDSMEEQMFPVNLSAPEAWIQLEIRSVYKGSKYEDTCIAEVGFPVLD